MKRLFSQLLLPMFLVTLIAVGCEKDDEGIRFPGLEGRWLWQRSFEGDAGQLIEPQAGDCPKHLVIGDLTFTYDSCDLVTSIEGYSFDIINEESEPDTVILLESGERYYFYMEEDILELAQTCFHCDVHYYERVP